MATAVKRKRWEMQVSLSEWALPQSWAHRPISQSDALLLGHLMYEAYDGTIDYGGELGFQVREEFTTRRPRLLSRARLRSSTDEEEAKGEEKA